MISVMRWSVVIVLQTRLLSCVLPICVFFFFKQKTAYEMRISDWSSDVCSSDLHRRPRRRNIPACTAKAFDQYIAAFLVELPVLLDDVLRAIDRGNGRRLNGRERTIIEIAFDARERGDQLLVADSKAHAPSRHGIGLGHGGEFHRDILRA